METGSPDVTYAAIGRALSAWHSVEMELCRVFCQASYPDRFHPLYSDSPDAQAYWSMFSIQQRLKAITRMMEVSPVGKLFFDQWMGLRQNIAKHSKKRNQLAHGTVVFNNGIAASGELETQYRFIPYFRSDGTSSLKPPDLFDAEWLPTKDIQEFEQIFKGLAGDVQVLMFAVKNHFIPDDVAFLRRFPIE
jgi:hypothetical protein